MPAITAPTVLMDLGACSSESGPRPEALVRRPRPDGRHRCVTFPFRALLSRRSGGRHHPDRDHPARARRGLLPPVRPRTTATAARGRTGPCRRSTSRPSSPRRASPRRPARSSRPPLAVGRGWTTSATTRSSRRVRAGNVCFGRLRQGTARAFVELQRRFGGSAGTLYACRERWNAAEEPDCNGTLVNPAANPRFYSTCWSNHAAGRALDLMSTKARGDAVVNWLLAPDANGNYSANARRLGVQQILWWDRCWNTDDDRGIVSAGRMRKCGIGHFDHVHVDLTFRGARGRTSYWGGRPVIAPKANGLVWWDQDTGRRMAPVVVQLPVDPAPHRLLEAAVGRRRVRGLRLRPGERRPPPVGPGHRRLARRDVAARRAAADDVQRALGDELGPDRRRRLGRRPPRGRPAALGRAHRARGSSRRGRPRARRAAAVAAGRSASTRSGSATSTRTTASTRCSFAIATADGSGSFRGTRSSPRSGGSTRGRRPTTSSSSATSTATAN